MSALVYASVTANERRVFVVELDDTTLPPLLAGRLAFRGVTPREVARRLLAVIREDEAGAATPATAPPPGAQKFAPVDLQQVDGEAVEDLARRLQNEPVLWQLARGQKANFAGLFYYLRGHGNIRVTIRQQAVSESLLLDLQSETKIAETHRRYIRFLRKDLSTGGLSVITPAFEIKLEERIQELEQTHKDIKNYLAALIQSADLCCDPAEPAPAPV